MNTAEYASQVYATLGTEFERVRDNLLCMGLRGRYASPQEPLLQVLKLSGVKIPYESNGILASDYTAYDRRGTPLKMESDEVVILKGAWFEEDSVRVKVNSGVRAFGLEYDTVGSDLRHEFKA